MATPQTPRARRSPLARYAPALAVVVVIAIIAVVIGLFSGGEKSKEVTTNTTRNGVADLPIFYNEAKAAGTLAQYTWPENCDTTTGLVKIPILTPPPCVPVVSDNGGATAPGVSATTIKIGYYAAKPDPLYDAIFRAAGAYDPPASTAQAYKDYLEIYASAYELYGRKIELVKIQGTGGSTDEVAAKADADKAAAAGVFAVLGGPAQAQNFQTELASKKVMCIGLGCVVAAPQARIEQNAPFLWPVSPTPEQTALHTTELVKKQLVGKKAIYAGDPALRAKDRAVALLSYDTPNGEYKESWETFYNDLKAAGVPVVGHISYFLNPASLAADGRTVANKLKATGATTIIFTGDPIFPSYLTTNMTQQGYFPEWVMSGTVLADTVVFARRFDQRQWSNAFGLQLTPARLPKPQQDSYTLHQWWFGTPPPTENNFSIVKGSVELLMDGLQLAGPKLTPETFRDGMNRVPAQTPGPLGLATIVSYGKHGFWPGTDVGGLDNAGILYWDPEATGPDETGNVGKGMYRLRDGGRRYLPGQWPTEPIEMFDPAGTVTIYEEADIPPELKPKPVPVPADAPANK